MKKLSNYLMLLFLFAITFGLNAQDKCGTDIVMERLMESKPRAFGSNEYLSKGYAQVYNY